MDNSKSIFLYVVGLLVLLISFLVVLDYWGAFIITDHVQFNQVMFTLQYLLGGVVVFATLLGLSEIIKLLQEISENIKD